MYTSRSTYSEAQQDANWDNLSAEQRAYFNRLAKGDPERAGQAFFEDTVPAELQDNPLLSVSQRWHRHHRYSTRGRAGGEYVATNTVLTATGLTTPPVQTVALTVQTTVAGKKLPTVPARRSTTAERAAADEAAARDANC